MKRNKKLRQTLEEFSSIKENVETLISGELGIPLDGARVVEVPSRAGYVFVRLKGNISELIQAYNNQVPAIYDYPVLVRRQRNTYVVVGKDQSKWSNIGNGGEDGGGGYTPLPKHGGQHSFNPSAGMGADVSWIYSRQVMPNLAYPSGSASMMLTINPQFYEYEGQWKWPTSTGTPSFAPYVPTVTGSARMALLYLNKVTNALEIASGPLFSGGITDPAALAPLIPDVDRSYGYPLAAVRLTTGMSAISWNEIYDMRDWFTVKVTTGSSGGGGGGSGLGVMVQDEGVPLGTGTTFNFVGDNVQATISGSVVRVYVTGSSGGSSATIDDLTSQIPAVGDHFDLLVEAAGDVLLFWNGVYQSPDYFTMDGDNLGLTTDFSPISGDTLVAVYGVAPGTTISATDSDAIHDNVSGEINGITEKASLHNDDLFVIEDSEASFAKKKAKKSNAFSMWSQVIDESGATFANFTGTAGSWGSNGSVITQTGTAASVAFARYQTIHPIMACILEVEVQVKTAGTSRRAGLVIGASTNSTAGAMVSYVDPGNDNLYVERGGSTLKLTAPATIDVDTWYKIRLVAFGSSCSAWLDEELMGTASDARDLANGIYVGLYSYQAVTWFRNFKGWILAGLPA